jgi:hypothetical protein
MLALLTCAWAALLLAPAPAYACTPPPGGLPRLTPADRTNRAQVVLEGTVSATSNTELTGAPVPDTATVDVVQYLKGSGPAQVTITGFGPSSLCRSEVQVGNRLIFYASGDPAQGLQAFYASQFDAVARPSPQVIAEITTAAGQQPVVPGAAPAPAAGATATPAATLPRSGDTGFGAVSLIVIALGGAVALLLLGGMVALWVTRRQ